MISYFPYWLSQSIAEGIRRAAILQILVSQGERNLARVQNIRGDEDWGEVVLIFETVEEILKCDHSIESYRALLFRGAAVLCCITWFQLLSLWMKS